VTEFSIHHITKKKTLSFLLYNISRKRTATNTIKHNKNHHPTKHKMSVINYMINRQNNTTRAETIRTWEEIKLNTYYNKPSTR
jgi:hypothetical protein